MTFPTDEAVTAVAAPAPAGLHFTPFQTTKGAARDCKKLAAVHVDRAAPGSIVGGSLFETMKASSPRRAADAEHGDWMVPCRHLLLPWGEIDRSATHFSFAVSVRRRSTRRH